MDESDWVNLYAVYYYDGSSWGGGWKYMSTSIYRDRLNTRTLETDMPNTLVARCSWYKQHPHEYIVVGEKYPDIDKETFCVMRGSKKGIGRNESSGRVYAYEYAVAYRMGQKFARYVKRTGKKVLQVKTSRMVDTTFNAQTSRILRDNFLYGFESVMGCDTKADFIQRTKMVDENAIISSSIYCIDFTDVEHDQRRAIRDMVDISNITEIEEHMAS